MDDDIVKIIKDTLEIIKILNEQKKDYIHSNPNGYYCYSDCFYAKIRSWMSGNL